MEDLNHGGKRPHKLMLTGRRTCALTGVNDVLSFDVNEILTALHRRKSVRAYTGEPVSAEQKEQILRAACAAPTAAGARWPAPR